MFPDLSTSPADYIRSLLTKRPQVAMVADAKEGDWIPTFSRVVHLEMVIDGTGVDEPETSLVPFHIPCKIQTSTSVLASPCSPSKDVLCIPRQYPLLCTCPGFRVSWVLRILVEQHRAQMYWYYGW